MPNIRIKLDVKKLVKKYFFEGAKGTYVDLVLWENRQPDKYGNTHSLKQSFPKEARDAGEQEPFVGEGKVMGQSGTAKAQERPAPQRRPAPQQDPDLDPDDGSQIPF